MTAPARDGLALPRVGTKKRAFRSNKETDEGQDMRCTAELLDKRSPIQGATENAATVQALLDNLVSRGLDPTVPRLFIADGAKALSKAIRRTFGPAAAIQRCQIHKARNIMERLPTEHHAATRRVLRQAWELDDADKAENLIRNLARRLDQQWPGVSASILEGLDEILTVVRLTLPKELRRSLACTNIAENMMGTIRRVTRNVKRWRDAGMALR
ncbi:transposase-like protein [Bradyrhizobium liaoningense]